jgi:secreted Zn-dependent insulinase-like peptidase
VEVVSSSHSVPQIREDILHFLNISFFALLSTLTPEQYSIYQTAVISRLEIPPISLYEAASDIWNEIEERRYSFHSKLDRLTALPTLTVDDVLIFYQKYFLESIDRRMMIIECCPKDCVGSGV